MMWIGVPEGLVARTAQRSSVRGQWWYWLREKLQSFISGVPIIFLVAPFLVVTQVYIEAIYWSRFGFISSSICVAFYYFACTAKDKRHRQISSKSISWGHFQSPFVYRSNRVVQVYIEAQLPRSKASKYAELKGTALEHVVRSMSWQAFGSYNNPFLSSSEIKWAPK